MVVEHSMENGILEVKPSGRLDSSTAGDFDEEVRAQLTDQVKTLVINMSEVDYISSKGVRILVSLHKIMNGKISLSGANTSVMEVLRLSGLLNIFEINKAGDR